MGSLVVAQARLADGLTADQFAVDVQQGTATCPAGHQVGLSYRDEQIMRFSYPEPLCRECALRSRCCTGMTCCERRVCARRRRPSRRTIANTAVASKAPFPPWCEVRDCEQVAILGLENATYKLYSPARPRTSVELPHGWQQTANQAERLGTADGKLTAASTNLETYIPPIPDGQVYVWHRVCQQYL